jgi:hypothetical protein
MGEREWQTACDRATLYIRAGSLPCLEGLELAADALREARASVARNPGLDPVAETMRQVREQLARRRSDALPCLKVPGDFPLNRGPMVPGKIARGLWGFRSARRVEPHKGPASRDQNTGKNGPGPFLEL